MGRAWGSQLQIPFGLERRPARTEAAADLIVWWCWWWSVWGQGASVSKLQGKPDQLIAKTNKRNKTSNK